MNMWPVFGIDYSVRMRTCLHPGQYDGLNDWRSGGAVRNVTRRVTSSWVLYCTNNGMSGRQINQWAMREEWYSSMRQYLLPFHQRSSEASVNVVNGTQHMVDKQCPQATLVTVILRVMLLYIFNSHSVTLSPRGGKSVWTQKLPTGLINQPSWYLLALNYW